MRIVNSVIPANGRFEDIQLETSVADIAIKITGDADLDLSSVILSADLVSRTTGTKAHLPKMSLLDYFELTADEEGFYTFTAKTCFGKVALSDLGAIQFSADTYLSVSITGLPEGNTLEMYAIDFPTNTKTAIHYDITNLSAGQSDKSVLLTGVNKVALPKGRIEKIAIFYPETKKTVTLTATELEMQMMSSDDLISISGDTHIFGSKNHYIVSTAFASKMEVTPTAGDAFNIVLLKERTI